MRLSLREPRGKRPFGAPATLVIEPSRCPLNSRKTMPDSTTATTRLFSWLRQGLHAGLTAAGSPATDGHLVVPIRLRVNGAQEINVPVKVYGPGDVTGVDPREI